MRRLLMVLTFVAIAAASLDTAEACNQRRAAGFRRWQAPPVVQQPVFQTPVFQQPVQPVFQPPTVRYQINWGGGLGWNGRSYQIKPGGAAMDYIRRNFGYSAARPGPF